MKKNRILSALLCLSLAAGLVIPGLPAYAEGEGESSSSGMKLSKSAEAIDSDTYKITLEAYATGEKVISQVKKDVPTDIVLVLDQSGSMKDDIGTVKFEEYKDINGRYGTEYNTRNRDYYEKRHNDGEGNLYYYDKNTGAYYSVSVSVVKIETPVELGNLTNSGYWNYSEGNLYEKVGEEYKPVKLDRTWVSTGIFRGYWSYTYKFYDDTTITSDRDDITPELGSHTPLYTLTVDENQNVYTYTYVDADNNIIEIGKSTGADTRFGTTLFQKVTSTSGGGSRLAALTSAVTIFTNNVAAKAAGEDGILGTADDINHRVAVVGYASRADSNDPWINTELFIGATQHNYNVDASSYYNKAFQDMNTQAGQDNVADSIGALGANGATYTNYGLEMANGILDAYKLQPNEKRNRVIVLFTDGYPGKNADDFNQTAANAALDEATTAKNAGVSVYSVGIFSGADASSAGDKNGTNTQAANWFMQQVSSNNGTPQTPSFYLSAADSATLSSIFQQIADNIETGGSSTTLNKEAVIKDIISPAFTLPEGATTSDITLETWQCTGKNSDGYTWTKNPTAMGAAATVNGDQVSVTGFDFADNYVGTVTDNGSVSYRGNKLVISFTVSPKAGFLGGNDVYTNTSAGVYESANAQNPVLTFDRPQVNVPIDSVTVKPADKNVYLLGTVTAAQLQEGATVKVGDVPLDLSKAGDAEEPYGLKPWQTEYVKIKVQITDKDDKEVTTPLSQLKDDTTYTITVTVTPNSDGKNASGTAATEQKGSGTANINVYKPELTYKDSEVFYGDAVPADTELAKNLTETKWKHGTSEATADMGTAPDLAITYKPEASKIDENNKIASTEDIQVAATVKIGDTDVTGSTTFLHTACAEGVTCGWSETTLDGDPAFLLHVKTATLIIQKSGASGTNEGFIFKVEGPENFRVSVKDNGTVKITGLPLGEYTVTEETGWSWRYQSVSISDNGTVNLTEDSDTATVKVTNSNKNTSLLDGNAYVQNISAPAAGN